MDTELLIIDDESEIIIEVDTDVEVLEVAEQGPPGPQGPQGPQGPPGPVGDAGGALGYGPGSGGTVTQTTSKSTGVVINTSCGRIITHEQSLPSGQSVLFNVINSNAYNSVAVVSIDISTSFHWEYRAEVVAVGNGGMVIRLTNLSTIPLESNVIINFALLKIAAT